MKVPEALSHAFEAQFEKCILEFGIQEGLLPDELALGSPRYLARAIVPHVTKLSKLFNRDQIEQESALSPYWKESSNPAHLRLAYFLYFMPPNAFRMASVWAELARLGFRWQPRELKALEFGAGPASGVCGVATGEHYTPVGLPRSGTWALLEQDKAILELGRKWAETYFTHLDYKDWSIRPFHRKLDVTQGFLPPSAPQFNLWLMSFYLNELTSTPAEIAEALVTSWQKHLENESLMILVEPALKLQSRKLLEIRREILLLIKKKKIDWLQLLLPCLGHQDCGALKEAEDWCHEEVTWWRPPYFRKIDKMAGLDRKTLPFSYLVFMKTKRQRHEVLPNLPGARADVRYRLVSPAHKEGKNWEFFVCGQDGKHRVRYYPRSRKEEPTHPIDRGDIMTSAEPVAGDPKRAKLSRGV